MVHDSAIGVRAAAIGTGLGAFLINASSVQRTFRADYALRSTSRRTADVIGQVRANSLAVVHAAQAVGPARRGTTGIPLCNGCKR